MPRPATLRRTIAALTRSAPGRRNGSGPPAADDLRAKLGYLSETDVFASLPHAERTWLAESTTMVTCERGRVFYAPDEPGEVVFILKRGRVNLYRLAPDGRKLVIATLDPYTIFGEMGLIGQGMYGCFAEAAEDCLICVLSRADLQALIRRNPGVGLRLLEVLGSRLQQREAELEALAFRGVPARLAALLLEEAGPFATVSGLSHQDLAERLGTYRETVTQALGRFRADGLVAVEPRLIRLLDRDRLQSIARA
jgi:CRP/FNR family cyclic AMP-dependent transcriptional regulator